VSSALGFASSAEAASVSADVSSVENWSPCYKIKYIQMLIHDVDRNVIEQ
jgi:hypothetical protein